MSALSNAAVVRPDAVFKVLDDPNLVLVDARFALNDPQQGATAYRESHLPGALYVDLERDLSDMSQTGRGRHPLPAETNFSALLERLGITPQHHVVVYDNTDGSMAAARFWWLMKLAGHRRVAVLDGGLEKWRRRQLPETDTQPAPSSSTYPVRFDTTRIVTANEVLAQLDNPGRWLWDARAVERYRGTVEPIDPIAGHVPGAFNRPYTDSLQDGEFKTAAQLRAEFDIQRQGTNTDALVLMCGSGVTACHLALAFSYAGLPEPRLFPGSWSEWISDPDRPVEKTL